MKLNKIANIVFILFFLSFLYLGMLVTVTKPKAAESYFENRALASIPILNKASFFNGSWFSDWESYLKDHAPARETLLKTNTYIDLFMIKRPVVNDIVVTEDKLLSYNKYETVDPREIAEQSALSADNLNGLKQCVRDNGGAFYDVAIPGQLAYDSGAYPAYLNSGAEYNKTLRACFKNEMTKRGIYTIDMGEVFDALGHPDTMFYATDHHFTFDGALLTYQTIMEAINAGQQLKLPVLSTQDMTVKTVENPFMGSRMRKLFNLLKTNDKLKIGIPKQTIPFTRTNNGNDVPSEVYALPLNAYETIGYTVYMGGDIGETVIKTNRPELPNVLIVGDSYTNAVECLLYTSFNEMHSIDLRWYANESLADYIKVYKPDIVIHLRDYSKLLSLEDNNAWK